MKLTKTERLILANQNKILSFLDIDNSENHLYKAEIAEKGYEGLYDSLFGNIHEGIGEDICNETHEILTMYRVINNCIADLKDEQKKTMDLKKISFVGFDANNDSHYFFMKFLVEKSNLYDEYKAVPNSHSIASLPKYKKMLAQYKKAIANNNYQLNLQGLEEIIKAV